MPRKLTKILSFFLCFLLIFQQSGFSQVAGELDISSHLAALHSAFSPDIFRPLHLRYLSYNPIDNNFQLFLDKGSLKNPSQAELKETTKQLLNYFYIGISLPNDIFWVNLRPDAEDNIIDDRLAQTDIGRIMLETDLQLKKDTAAFTSPETPEGREYWDKLYKKAGELFGSQNITIPTLTRPWIVPDEIIIRETAGEASGTELSPEHSEGRSEVLPSAYIYKATLKVMLEQDYLQIPSSAVIASPEGGPVIASDQPAVIASDPSSLRGGRSPTKQSLYNTYSFKDPRLKELNEYSTQLIKELIIPKLTKEVNSSKRYAQLRQVYYSLIMAQWFKARFSSLQGEEERSLPAGRQAISSRINSGNLTNLTSKDPWSKTTYFQAYQKSFKDGEYNIQEPVQSIYGQTIRSYFSGGESLINFNIPPFGEMPVINSDGPKTSLGPAKGTLVLRRTEIKEEFRVDGRLTIISQKSTKEQDSDVSSSSPMKSSIKEAEEVRDALENGDIRTVIYLMDLILTSNQPKTRPDSNTIDSAIEAAQNILKNIGSIDDIRQMSLEDFTEAIGVFEVDIGIGMFTLDSKSAEVFRRVRELAGGADAVWKKILGATIYMAPETIPEIIWLFHPSVQKEGIYYSPAAYQESGVSPTKSAFFHELLESKFAERGAIDSGFNYFFRHAHPRILEEDLKFAYEMGELETRINAWSGQIETIKRLIKDDTRKEIADKYIRDIEEVLNKYGWSSSPVSISDETKLLASSPAEDNKQSSPLGGPATTPDPARLIYEVQAADLDNLDEVLNLREKYFVPELKERVSDGVASSDNFRRKYSELIQSGEVKLFIARAKGTIIGYSLSRKGREHGWIYELAVDPAYRGQGVGGELFDRALNFLKEGQIRRTTIIVSDLSVGGVTTAIAKGRGFTEDENGKLRLVVSLPTTTSGTTDVLENGGVSKLSGNTSGSSAQTKPASSPANLQSQEIVGGIDGSASSPLSSLDPSLRSGSIPRQDYLGGIDFRALPIVRQAVTNLSEMLKGSSPLRGQSLLRVNLNEEWREIERITSAGMTPSVERLKEYIQSSCAQGSITQDKDKILLCISDILRLQEQSCDPTDDTLRDILVILESMNSAQEFKEVFLGAVS